MQGGAQTRPLAHVCLRYRASNPTPPLDIRQKVSLTRNKLRSAASLRVYNFHLPLLHFFFLRLYATLHSQQVLHICV
jgi:hypothetical protein